MSTNDLHLAPSELDHDTTGLEFRMLIGGELCASSDGRTFEAVDPYSRTPFGRLPDATDTDVEAAMLAARTAGASGPWPGTAAHERGQLLHRLGDLIEAEAEVIGRLETLDTGKLQRETEKQARFAARTYRYYAGYADKLDGRVVAAEDPQLLDLVLHEPIGTCVLLTAWNSPMQLLANKLAPALAAGNTVVVRPSEHAGASTAHLGHLLGEAGVPDGVVNILTSSDAVAAQALTEHPATDLISLTGGVPTGRAVGRVGGERLTRVVTELGGKSPNIVFEDADLEAALAGIEAGIFAAGGQTCIAGSRLLVHSAVAEELLDRLIARAAQMKLGDPLDPATEIGPLANDRHHARVREHLSGALRDGAELRCGGPSEESGGNFFAPTVLTGVDPSMSIAREEVFGPVLAVMTFDDDDDAIEIANGTSFGLAAGIWTKDLSRAIRTTRRLRAGSVWVNTYRRVAPAAPFGGTGQSGIGRERGLEGLLEYTQTKNVMIDPS